MQFSLAATGGVFLQQIFFHCFVVFGLSLGQSLWSGVGFESFQSSFDRLFDLDIVASAFFRLPGGLFGRLNNRHIVIISYYIKKLVIGIIIANFGEIVKG